MHHHTTVPLIYAKWGHAKGKHELTLKLIFEVEDGKEVFLYLDKDGNDKKDDKIAEFRGLDTTQRTAKKVNDEVDIFYKVVGEGRSKNINKKEILVKTSKKENYLSLKKQIAEQEVQILMYDVGAKHEHAKALDLVKEEIAANNNFPFKQLSHLQSLLGESNIFYQNFLYAFGEEDNINKSEFEEYIDKPHEPGHIKIIIGSGGNLIT